MFIANEWFVNFDIDVIELSSLYFNLNKNNQGNPYCVLIYHNLKCVQSDFIDLPNQYSFITCTNDFIAQMTRCRI